METDKDTSVRTAIKIHNQYSNVFMVIGCFEDTFPFKVKEDTKPYQVSPRCVAYELKDPFQNSLKDYKDIRYSCH